MTVKLGEVSLTELEAAVLQVMVRYKVFSNEDVIHELRILIEKLKMSIKTDD